jgi:magnesium transporter
MSKPQIRSDIQELTHLIWERDHDGLARFIEGLPPTDLFLAISRLESSDRCELFELLEPAAAGSILVNLKELSPHKLLAQLSPETAADILHQLPVNVETDLIAAMKRSKAERILSLLPGREIAEVRNLARYEPDVAGGLMETEILSYAESFSVQDVIDDMRRNAAAYADYNVQYIYVTRGDRTLVGVLRVRNLLLANADTVLGDLIIDEPTTVDHQTPLDEIRDLFDRYRYLGLPVVDEGRLVGVIRRAAVEEAIAQKTARQFRLVQGIIGGEEVRTMPVSLRSGRRLAFLSANIVLNIIAASVIVYFEDTLTRLIALAAFLPIISDMSGCSGNQAVAVSMRELALGLVRPREVVRVLAKEVSVGLVNGAALGVVAVSIGGSVPLILKGFGVDPALASGPILTTVTDICGFFFALGFAALALSRGFL